MAPPVDESSLRPTLSNVALRCGVSKGAVSLALNRSLAASRLREETYRKIHEVAVELGYRPDWRGRALVKGKIHSVGLLTGRLAPHVTDVYEQLYDVVADTLNMRGYHLQFVPAVGNQSGWRKMLEEQRVEGCLVVPPMPFELPGVLKSCRMPAVLMNEMSNEALPQLLPDDAGGMRLVLEHLHGLGHRRIAFYVSSQTTLHHSVGVRRKAFLEFAAQHGIADVCEIVDAGLPEAFAESLAVALAAGAPAPTAVVAYKASSAIDLAHAFWRRGVSVPRDISFATFDDSWVLSRLTPPLTAVSVPVNEIGRRAADMLVDALEKPGSPEPGVIVIPEKLVARESTAAPRDGWK